MTVRRLQPLPYGFLLAAQLLMGPTAQAQDKVLKAGASVDLGNAFWANGCTSMLVTVVGVDLLDGPSGVQLSLRNEDVYPRQQNCPKVAGAVVVASVKDVAAPTTGTVRYRVRYKTLDGLRQSEHSVPVSLEP